MRSESQIRNWLAPLKKINNFSDGYVLIGVLRQGTCSFYHTTEFVEAEEDVLSSGYKQFKEDCAPSKCR